MNRFTPRAATRAAALGLLAGALLAVPVRGQTVSRAEDGVRVAGRVVDAASGTAMAGATVVLEPEVAGAFPGAAAGSGFTAAARTTRTDSLGRYVFTGLAPGRYRLYAARFGYRPYALTLELGRSGTTVSVGLQADPIALEPLRGRSRGRGPYVAADPYASDLERARLLVTDLRRRRFLSTDVRELTHADVVEGVTLGEPDIFRALQRLPGVTTRSDYTAALWTRGAPWSQTRVYYDGIPLFNPLHALGMISGISSSSVGTVWFHPGVRSAGMGEGAAGIIDLRSRPAGGTGRLNVQADASLATAGVALDQRVLDGRAGWMLSGRRSYLDWLADLARRAADAEDARFPYHFTETAGRLDIGVTDTHVIEASWLWEGDQLTSDATAQTDPLRATWGNALGRLTWSGTWGDYRLQHTLGGSRHHGLVRVEALRNEPASDDALRRSETGVDYLVARGAFWPDDGSLAGPGWSVGYEVARHGVTYEGPLPLPVPRAEALAVPNYAPEDTPTFSNGGLDSAWTSWEADLPVVALWGEKTWSAGSAVTFRAGLRAETGALVREAPPVRFAPRMALRYSPAPELALSAGLARVYQYAQAIAPGGVHLASLVSTDAWILAGAGVPAIRSDIATAGVESWVAPGRIVALNGFARNAAGVVVPNPEPGPIVDRSPTLVLGSNTAFGVEASVRQLTGPLTGSVSYSLTRSRVRVEGRDFPSAADRTHVLNATGMVHPLASLRLGAAFTAASGVPFTRAVSDPEECADEPGCSADELPWAGEPNASRGPVYASLDLLLDWSTTVRGLQLGLYGQLRNVLGRENATVYTGGSGCLVVGCTTDGLRNAFEEGVPRLPVIGIRVQR